MIMYSTRLVGAIVMTSSTLWPPITNDSPHDGHLVPLEFTFSTHRLESLCLLLFFFFIIFSHLGPSQDHPPVHKPHPATFCHGLWSHTGIVSDLNETGPVQLSCGILQSSRLVFKMGLHCKHNRQIGLF